MKMMYAKLSEREEWLTVYVRHGEPTRWYRVNLWLNTKNPGITVKELPDDFEYPDGPSCMMLHGGGRDKLFLEVMVCDRMKFVVLQLEPPVVMIKEFATDARHKVEKFIREDLDEVWRKHLRKSLR